MSAARRRMGAAAAAVVAWAAVVEPRLTAVRRVELALPRWPGALDGLRVALVGDLHAGGPHRGLGHAEALARLVLAERPDLVAFLGDLVDPAVLGGSRLEAEEVAQRLRGLSGVPLGAVAVLGNHDWRYDGPRVAAALAAAGMRVLEDEAVALPGRGGAELWIAGVGDERTRRPDVRWAIEDVPAHAGLLLLSHDPDVFPRVPPRVALTLSGHLHGGQLRVPGLRRPFVPSRFGLRYLSGHVVEGGRHLYVTAGAGESGLPVRLGVRPEVVVLTLRPAGTPGDRPSVRAVASRAATRRRAGQ